MSVSTLVDVSIAGRTRPPRVTRTPRNSTHQVTDSAVAVHLAAWVSQDFAECSTVVGVALACVGVSVDNTSSVLTAVFEACVNVISVGFAVFADKVSVTFALVSVVGVHAESTVLARVVWEASVVFVNYFEDVWEEVVDVGVDTWVLLLGTSDTEGDNSGKHFQVGMFSANLGQVPSANERSAGVSLASVEASFFVSGADVLFSVDQDVLGLVPVHAGLVSQNGNVHLVQNTLVTSESCISPSGNGAVFFVASVVWWWEVVWETDGPHEFVKLNVLGGLEKADIVNDLSGAHSVAFVAGDAFEEVGFLVARFVDFVVGSDDDLVSGWGLVPSDEAMSSGKNVSVVDNGTVAELTISAESFV